MNNLKTPQQAIIDLQVNIDKINACARLDPHALVVVTPDCMYAVQYGDDKIAKVAIWPELPTIFENNNAAYHCAKNFVVWSEDGKGIGLVTERLRNFARKYEEMAMNAVMGLNILSIENPQD